MANRYQWLSAAERLRIGTLAAVSTWHGKIRPGSPLRTFGRGVARGTARRSREGARVEGCVAVGSHWKRLLEVNSAERVRLRVSPHTNVRARTTRRSDAGLTTAISGRPTDSPRYVRVSDAW